MDRESGAHRCNGAGSTKTQGGARASSSGRGIAKSGDAVAGPGQRGVRMANAHAVEATGSCEGSLPMEGIPDHGKRRLSRGGVESGLGGSLARGTRARLQKSASGTFSTSTHEGA
jgi:hypothetical protein